MKKLLFSLLTCFHILSANAKTVALWPLNIDGQKKLDARCAIDSRNDFTVAGQGISCQQVADWTLPPNHKEQAFLRMPYNFGAIGSATLAWHTPGLLQVSDVSPDLFNAVNGINSFTAEGWLRLDEMPPEGEYFSLMQSVCGGNALLWTIRNSRTDAQGNKIYTFEFYSSVNNTDNILFSIGEDASEYLGRFRHYAFVYDAANSQAKLYVDGQLLGGVSIDVADTVTNANSKLTLAGKDVHVYKAVADYWRISDVVLSPSEFLNAPGAGGQSYDFRKTVAYWPLRANDDGTVDVRDYAGDADLSSLIRRDNYPFDELQLVRGVSAFKGQPPNTAITIPTSGTEGAHVAKGNQDCFGAFSYCSMGRIYDLARYDRASGFNASFTLEVFYCPVQKERLLPTSNDESVAYFLTSMDPGTTTNGWALQIVRGEKGLSGGTSHWRLVFSDPDSAKEDGTVDYIAYGDFTGGTFVEGDGVWRHIALAYTAGGGSKGFGMWELFVDGVSCGTIENQRAACNQKRSSDVYIMSNKAQTGQTYGYIDCFAYSTAAITPEQFLCEKANPKANPSLKALLPLDASVVQSALPYGKCVLGNTVFYMNKEQTRSLYPVLNEDDGPAVSNADALAGEEERTGSVTFRSGNNGKYSRLGTRDENVISLFRNGNTDLTIEGYFKRNAKIGSYWDIMFYCYQADNKNLLFSTTYRANNRIQLWDSAVSKNSDFYFNAATAPVSSMMDDWVHMAWVRENRNWTLYQDGEKISTIAGSSAVTVAPGTFIIGGRHDARSWQGSISEVRLTQGALTPAEFLCASNPNRRNPAPPRPSKKTQAFWYLDDNEGNAVLKESVFCGEYDFAGVAVSTASDGVPPSSRRADDSGAFSDKSSSNNGAVTVNATELTALGLGEWLDATDAFTVEGWLRRADAEWTAVEKLFGTWDGSKGWYLGAEKNDAGKIEFTVRMESATTCYVNTRFDKTLEGLDAWQHLALAYDAAEGKGTWHLYVDGKSLGTVENMCMPEVGSCGAGTFKLGSEAFAGDFDLWRVSVGVRANAPGETEGFLTLFRFERGTMILIL